MCWSSQEKRRWAEEQQRDVQETKEEPSWQWVAEEKPVEETVEEPERELVRV